MKSKSKVESAASARSEASTGLVSLIRIAGTDYRVGDKLEIDGEKLTVEGKKFLKVSPNSGVAAGTYPIVWLMLGDRKAHRAVVDGTLYPVRSYGTAKEILAKNRENHEKAAPAPRAPRATTGGKASQSLSAAAEKLIGRLLDLKPETDRSAVLSELVVAHVPAAIEKVEGLQLAIKQLPHDLLVRLSEVDEATRERVLAMLAGNK